MNRRNLLTTLGGAGAIGLGGYFIAGTLADEELQRRVSLAGQDSVPDDYEVDIDVELLESTITNLHTARLQITTTNEGPERAISIGNDGCALFSRGAGGSDEPEGLWLHPPANARQIDREDDRWERAPSDQPRGFPLYGCGPTRYDAGESLSNEYVVWDDYTVDGYLEPGTYRWEEGVSIQDERFDSDEPTSKTWGFSLTVENVD